jgi:hypothetical protein
MSYLGDTYYWFGPNGTFVDISAKRRNAIVSTISGGIFAIGWWFFVDVYSRHLDLDHGGLRNEYWIPGILSTLGLILVMAIPHKLLRGDDLTRREDSTGSKFFALLCFFVLFCGLAGAIWVFVAGYLIPSRAHHATHRPSNYKDYPVDPPRPVHPNFHIWPGIAILVQNICIFASAFLFKFGKIDSDVYI